jgi:hypothetical protein
MIMALGYCAFRPALPYLWELARQPFEATMAYVALGDAVVRLERESPEDPQPVLRVLDIANPMLVAGAVQAVAVLHLVLPSAVIERLIALATQQPAWHPLRGEIVRAAPGWSGPQVEAYLAEILTSEPAQSWLHQAARAAQQKKYTTYEPW